jgi:hypothetical protein
MAELADAPDSKSGSRKRVGVRPSLWAPCSRTELVRATRSLFPVGMMSTLDSFVSLP